MHCSCIITIDVRVFYNGLQRKSVYMDSTAVVGRYWPAYIVISIIIICRYAYLYNIVKSNSYEGYDGV